MAKAIFPCPSNELGTLATSAQLMISQGEINVRRKVPSDTTITHVLARIIAWPNIRVRIAPRFPRRRASTTTVTQAMPIQKNDNPAKNAKRAPIGAFTLNAKPIAAPIFESDFLPETDEITMNDETIPEGVNA